MAERTYQQKVATPGLTALADSHELIVFSRDPDGQDGILVADFFGGSGTTGKAGRSHQGHAGTHSDARALSNPRAANQWHPACLSQCGKFLVSEFDTS